MRDLPARVAEIPAHHDFLRLGERPTAAWLVLDGAVGRFAQTSSGQRQMLSVYIAGEIAGLDSAAASSANIGMQAFGPSTVLKLSHEVLVAAAERHPAIARAFWRESALEGLKISHWLINCGRRDAAAGLANFLCEMACRTLNAVPRRAAQFSLPLTQSHLGDILGLSPVHVNRTLRHLREIGLVQLDHHAVTIPDWPALAALGEFDASYLCLETECPTGTAREPKRR